MPAASANIYPCIPLQCPGPRAARTRYRRSVSPEFIKPEDPAYDSARLSWNLAADQRPAAIVFAKSVDEVRESVTWAKENGLRVACQTTGHSAPALPDLGDALLLKTDLFDDDIDIDSNTLTARVPAGATSGDVVSAAAEHGFAFLHGSSPTVGVVGYLLGGGLSTFGRSFGLACNRVVSFQLVTEDGELVTADLATNPDLFWALRGGGGGLGVVTAVEVELLNMSEAFAGATFFAISDARAVLETWIEWTRTAPESATTDFRIMRLPPFEEIPEPIRGQAVVCVDGVSLDPVVGEHFAALIESAGTPVMGGWGIQPVADLVRLHGDPEQPVPGIGDSALLNDLDEAAITAFLGAVGEDSSATLIVAELRHIGGALATPAEDGGALDHLEGRYTLNGIGLAAGPDMTAKAVADLDQMIAAMRPFASEVKFLNFTERNFELADCFPAEVIERLTKVFDRYSPDRTFVSSRSIDGKAG